MLFFGVPMVVPQIDKSANTRAMRIHDPWKRTTLMRKLIAATLASAPAEIPAS
jgi:hypothetical protein